MDLMEAVHTSDKRVASKLGGQADAASGPRMRSLEEALQSQQEALLASMQASVDITLGEAEYRASNLASAHRTVEARSDELRSDPTELQDSSDEQMRRSLVELDVHRELVARQRAIEDWLAERQEAEQGRHPTGDI
jgi:hypothetical protein